MQWYDGGIAQAVTVSRQNGSIFVVFIKGNDDKSIRFSNLLNQPHASEILQSNNFVAIKVDADSVPHQQFSEIYKQTPIPSLYFIGKTGAALEIITDVNDEVELINKIDNIVTINGGTPIKISQAAASVNLIKNEIELNEPTKMEEIVPAPTTSTTETPTEDSEPPLTVETKLALAQELIDKKQNELKEAEEKEVSEPPLSVEAKLALAQQLIDKKRELKEAEEKENEKAKEVERRQQGQDLQKMQRWQQDQEIKQMMEERDKERREERAARNRILDQIKQDKADRAAKFSPPNEPAANLPQTSTQSPKVPTANSARLQFKLPDGSSHTHDFTSSSSLQEVVNYVRTNIKLTFTNFVLSTTFPRREFTANDHSQNLLDLQLCPNAVILVLPTSHGSVTTTNDGGLMGMFWYLIRPLLNIYGYLKAFIFGEAPAAATSSHTSTDNKRPAVNKQSSDETRPKRHAGEAAIRRQGNSNIHRLSDKDSDDDNNTWNGNSTQQM